MCPSCFEFRVSRLIQCVSFMIIGAFRRFGGHLACGGWCSNNLKIELRELEKQYQKLAGLAGAFTFGEKIDPSASSGHRFGYIWVIYRPLLLLCNWDPYVSCRAFFVLWGRRASAGSRDCGWWKRGGN